MAQVGASGIAGFIEATLQQNDARVCRIYVVGKVLASSGNVSLIDKGVNYKAWMEAVRKDMPFYRMFDVQEQGYMGVQKEVWQLTRFNKQKKQREIIEENVLSYRKKDSMVQVLESSPALLLESFVQEPTEFPNFDNIPIYTKSVMQFHYPRNSLVGININFVKSRFSHECYLEGKYNQFNKERFVQLAEEALRKYFH